MGRPKGSKNKPKAAKTAKRPVPRERRPKQQRFEGMEPGGHPDVDEAGDIYYDRKLDHKQLTQQLKDAKIQLIEKMIEHGLTRYETPDGLIVERTSKNEVSCKKKDDAGESEEGSDE